MITVLWIWTAAIVLIEVVVTFIAEGEDIMGLPLVWLLGIVAIGAPWVFYALYNIFNWAAG